MNYILIIICTLGIHGWTFAQVDTLTRSAELPVIRPQEISDSLKKSNEFNSIHYLKYLLNSKIGNLQYANPRLKAPPININQYQFTKEELNSGLSEEELIAYKKNKEELKQILANIYESRKGPEFLQPILETLEKAKNILAIILAIMAL